MSTRTKKRPQDRPQPAYKRILYKPTLCSICGAEIIQTKNHLCSECAAFIRKKHEEDL